MDRFGEKSAHRCQMPDLVGNSQNSLTAEYVSERKSNDNRRFSYSSPLHPIPDHDNTTIGIAREHGLFLFGFALDKRDVPCSDSLWNVHDAIFYDIIFLWNIAERA
jgi:hypothetical protein